jgi:hypothetical protein
MVGVALPVEHAWKAFNIADHIRSVPYKICPTMEQAINPANRKDPVRRYPTEVI